jgi:hypothetical protein
MGKAADRLSNQYDWNAGEISGNFNETGGGGSAAGGLMRKWHAARPRYSAAIMALMVDFGA